MKVTYTEEAVADIVQAITYLNELNPTAAATLDEEIERCSFDAAIRVIHFASLLNVVLFP